MSTVHRIEAAFNRLAARPGFIERPAQRQLSLLLNDLIEGKAPGCFEAPTGLGKSLATLIPAIAHGLEHGTRTVIATYTNVLAEQYWRNDLPLAMSLFDEEVKAAFVIGRQKFVCLAAAQEKGGTLANDLRDHLELGIETEFRALGMKRTVHFSEIAAPPVCPARLCPHYDDCFYFRARRQAEKSQIIISNHSVVISDALQAQSAEESAGFLGEYDYLILDEAHDFPQAALSGLEFELSQPKLGALIGLSIRLEKALSTAAAKFGSLDAWNRACEIFRNQIEKAQKDLVAYAINLGDPGILRIEPAELKENPGVKRSVVEQATPGAQRIALEVAEVANAFSKGVMDMLTEWKDRDGEGMKTGAETARTYLGYIRDYATGALAMFDSDGTSVTYVGRQGEDAIVRRDLVALDLPLKDLLWNHKPTTCLSATLALDGNFDFFIRTTGFEPTFSEILPSPFDHSVQAALYLPALHEVPDPAQSRGAEEAYYSALAHELSQIIRLLGGKTLALFHSRKEMQGVHERMDLPDELPVIMQQRYGVAAAGEQFKREVATSLFALRSYWTGFDAPGETLSCVALVRVPFEVPVDPPQLARMAWLSSLGFDPFAAHSLPQAKMIMRQGAGRLIRRDADRGLIAILDPRIRTKRYGEEILANLPQDMRQFDDAADAIGWLGLGHDPDA